MKQVIIFLRLSVRTLVSVRSLCEGSFQVGEKRDMECENMCESEECVREVAK